MTCIQMHIVALSKPEVQGRCCKVCLLVWLLS